MPTQQQIADTSQQHIVDFLQRTQAGPMAEEEIKFLGDVCSFIDFAIRNGLSFRSAMSYLSHDWNELARYGYDFEAVKSTGFHPRVTGFSDLTSNAVGDPE